MPTGLHEYASFTPLSFCVFLDMWGCPSGYLMLESNCFKMFRTPKIFADAELACQKEGGMVAKPLTLLQVSIQSNE